MKVALVHDWLTGYRGGERCLSVFLEQYPQADIFTLVHVPGATRPEIDARVKSVSWLRFFPNVRRYYRALLPLFPAAARSLDLKEYDLVISLSHAAAKNVSVAPGARHIVYLFTPMRYVWDQIRHYFGAATGFLSPIIYYLRHWDRKGSVRPNDIVGISRFVAARVRCFYRRSAHVIYPPTDTAWIRPIEKFEKGEAFLYAGALVPYKRVDLIVEAFNELREPLWIVGSGPDRARLEKLAGENIRFLGSVSDEALADYYRRCRALIFPGVEDFGMIPVECMAAGRPVIGIYAGALRETVRGLASWAVRSQRVRPEEATGVFYLRPRKTATHAAEVRALVNAVRFFSEVEEQIKPEACVKQASHFSKLEFLKRWRELAES